MTANSDIRNEDLILYIASKLKNYESFGAIVLNKVLYYSDNLHYLKYGRTISSFTYIHKPFGPVPNPTTFKIVYQKLIRDGRAKEEITDGIVNTRKKLVALKKATKSYFSKDELKVIDEVIKDFENKNALEASDKSHNELGWLLTEEGETIPPHAFLLSIPQLSEEDYTWADDELSRLRPN